MRRRIPRLLAVLLVAGGLCGGAVGGGAADGGGGAAPARGPAPSVDPATVEAGIVAGINAQRAAAGLPSLQLDPDLVMVARERANDMAQRGYFSHVSPTGETFS